MHRVSPDVKFQKFTRNCKNSENLFHSFFSVLEHRSCVPSFARINQLLHWSGFCWRCLSPCWTARASCSHIGDNGKWGSISRARGELAEDKGPSFELQGGYAINHQGSWPGRHGSWGVCLPWLSYPFNNRKHLWHQPPKCHHSCCHAKPRKSDLEVTTCYLNEAEAVQRVHLTNIPVWFGLVGNIKKGRTLDQCTRPVVSVYAAWNQMVPICPEWWRMEANEAIQTHCYNPVAPTYPVWAYYAHGRQRRCQEDPVSPPSSGLKKTTRSSLHHVARYRPTGSETTPYAPWSSRFGSEPPYVEDDVNIWRYAISEMHVRNDDDTHRQTSIRKWWANPNRDSI